MLTYEIKTKLLSVPSPIVYGNMLFFDSWEDPEDFYTMGVKKRHALKRQYLKLSKDPTKDNMWIWFGSYSKEGKPRINNYSVPAYLYQIMIKPTNSGRLRGVLTSCNSDVNPFKYFNSFKASALDIAAHRAVLSGAKIADTLNPDKLAKFNTLVAEALDDIKLYYFEGITKEELKEMMVTMNHMPLVIDEAIKQSGLFK